MAVNILILMICMLAATLALSLVARRLKIPPAAAFVTGGMAVAVIPGMPSFELDPDLVLALFLPPLLQSSAYFTSWRSFRNELRPILMLAVGAVFFTTLVVGLAAKALAPELPWAACFALGAIVSPPDAVAAASILKSVRIPRRLVTVLEGESLVNDASGLVLYRIAIAAGLTGTFSVYQAATSFVLVAAGGIALGAIVGFVFLKILPRLRDANLEIVSSFIAAYASYLGAEHAHVSGVLATVTCGLIMGYFQHRMMSSQTRLKAQSAWGATTFVMEAFVFVMIGLSLRNVLQNVREGELPGMLGFALAVTLVVVAARFAWVYGTFVLRRAFTKRRVERGVPLVMSWCGMRGVVTLAVALAVPNEFPGRDLMLLASFAVIAGTVLVQGMTLAPIVRAISFDESKGQGAGRSPFAIRADLAAAELAHLESSSGGQTSKAAEFMGQQLRHRMSLLNQFDEDDAPEHGVKLRLSALRTARKRLIQLHESAEVDDELFRQLEHELDLEEIRIDGLAPR